MAPRGKRFTIYDMMEANGLFESNPANVDSRNAQGFPLYKGPQEYPKMLYHPKGELEMTSPGELVATPFGPKKLGEMWQLKSKVVETEEEAKALLAEGWHDHPAKANASRTGEAMPVSQPTPQEVDAMRAEMARLQALVAEHDAAALAPPKKGASPSPSKALEG